MSASTSNPLMGSLCDHTSQSHPQRHSVLMLTWEYPPYHVGGLGTAVQGLSRRLAADCGFDVHVITCGAQDSPAYHYTEGVHVHRVVPLQSLTPVPFMDWVFALNLAIADRALHLSEQGVRFDVVHAHDWLVYEAALELKLALKLPLVATVHATEYGRTGGSLRTETQVCIHEQECRLVYEAAHVIVCSEAMADELVLATRLARSKLTVIPGGVAIGTTSDQRALAEPALGSAHGPALSPDSGPAPGPASGPAPVPALSPAPVPALGPAPLSAPLSAPLPVPGLLFIGRLVPEKGVHILLDTFFLIIQRYPTARLIIAGIGPAEAQLRQQAAPFGDQVTFVGFVQPAERDALLRKATALIVPSLYEPFGLVALEAIACHCPVIASNVGGLGEILSESTGFLCEPNNIEALASTINHILMYPNIAQNITNYAYQYAEKNYSWTSIAEQTNHIYQVYIGKSSTFC